MAMFTLRSGFYFFIIKVITEEFWQLMTNVSEFVLCLGLALSGMQLHHGPRNISMLTKLISSFHFSKKRYAVLLATRVFMLQLSSYKQLFQNLQNCPKHNYPCA
jgi:hypothetical protein